jgi:thioesterase domain-containing protein
MRELPGPQVVYGLCPPDRGSEKLPDVPELAAIYLQAVRRVQPTGPYFLVGECVGGSVAFEIALQLERVGESVGALILLDSWCPSTIGERFYRWVERPLFILKDRIVIARAAAADLALVTRGHRDAVRRLPPHRRVDQLKEAVRSLTRVGANWAKRLVTLTAPGSHASQHAAERDYVRTLMRYRPSVFSGPVTLIASDASLRGGIAAGWRRWTPGGLVIHRVPGNHDSYLHEHAAVTLDHLAAALGKQL